MLVGVLLALPSSWVITAPMALYAAGVGLTLPQAAACAMAPFPRHAGAASSLLGICQMTFAALVGVGLGQALGASPLPLPLVVAATGLLAYTLFWSAPRTP
jgi:DHA1 family bicyclomycin/chloramphenicol resistance-like MFS transporter